MTKHALLKNLRQRQVHLDFHTSQLIPQVGEAFDADDFADTVKAAHVDSITVFAVCHHGLAYFPSKVMPRHPGLSFDLLGRQIKALHKRGIRCPVYITVAWNYLQARLHPEWKMVDKNGADYQDGGPGFYANLQFIDTPYEQMLRAVTEEVLNAYDVDGLFYDIVFAPRQNGGPYDPVSTAIRRKFGWMEPTDENAARLDTYLHSQFALRMNRVIRKINKGCSIFYNMPHFQVADGGLGEREELRYQTHMEMESLPSGFWGYFHFPMLARMTQSLGIVGLGMTGRFQKSWGDFGGRKTRAALEYECFRSQALGFGNSVGDQLHPSGRICKSTYQLIGQVYAQTEWAEPFYEDSQPAPQVGILAPNHPRLKGEESLRATEGAVLVMEELHYESQLIDDRVPLDRYDLVVLPDFVPVGEALAARLKAYRQKGGKLLISGRSGLDLDGRWQLGFLGYRHVDTEPLYPTFLRYPRELFPGREPMDEVMYEPGVQLEHGKPWTVWVKRVLPYFNRTSNTFCSHFHTPPERVSEFPAAIRADRAVVFADPLFAAYRKSGNEIYRMLAQAAVESLIGPPPFGRGLPLTVLQTVRRRGRDALITLLHYIPIRKSTAIDVIDAPSPLGGLRFELRTGRAPKAISIFGGDGQLALTRGADHQAVVLPNVNGRILLTIKDVF